MDTFHDSERLQRQRVRSRATLDYRGGCGLRNGYKRGTKEHTWYEERAAELTQYTAMSADMGKLQAI